MAVSASAIRQYAYSQLSDIITESNGLNIIAVVVDIVRQPWLSRGVHRDALMLVALADETRDRVLTTVFASALDRLPRLLPGRVFIGHRLKSELFHGEMRLTVFPRIGGTVYVLPESSDPADVDVDYVDGRGEDADSLVAKSILADRRLFPQGAGITDVDLARVRELRRWFRNFRPTPSGPLPQSAAASSASSCHRILLSGLSELRLESGGSRKFVDLVAQLVAVGRLDDTCMVARVWDGTEVSAVTFRPDPVATNVEIREWPELPSGWLADRYSVDIFVYDEHREPLLSGHVKLGDLVEFGNLSVKVFKAADSGLGGRREQLLLTLNGGGRNYNRRLRKLDPEFCSLASRTSQQLQFVRRHRLPRPPLPPAMTAAEGREAAVDAATTTVATTTALVTRADERLGDIERVGLAELIKSASESEAGHRVIRCTLLHLLPASADRLVWLLCPNCPDAVFGPEEFLLMDSDDVAMDGVDLDADRQLVCRRCRQRQPRLRASPCLCLHLTDSDAELLAFAWDAEALRLLAGCHDNKDNSNGGGEDDKEPLDAERLARDAGLRRRVFSALRERLPTGARVELSVLHYRAANDALVFAIVDTRLVSRADEDADDYSFD